MIDIYTEVTERIIEQMEKGYIPWERPWVGNSNTVSHATGKTYSVLNQILLGAPGEYATFKQVQDEGGHVKKGAKSKMVVFWTILQDTDKDGNVRQIPYLKYSRVFSLDDCEGVKPKYIDDDRTFDNQPIEQAQAMLDSYINREGIKLEQDNGARSFYRPSEDMIHLPLFEKFINAESFYDTAFHECVHSTGHSKRLDRNGITNLTMFGNDEYSKEELIAEIGACSMCHQLGIETQSTFRNNAAYIQGWLKALKNDKRLLVSASSAADKAVRFIIGEEKLENESERG